MGTLHCNKVHASLANAIISNDLCITKMRGKKRQNQNVEEAKSNNNNNTNDCVDLQIYETIINSLGDSIIIFYSFSFIVIVHCAMGICVCFGRSPVGNFGKVFFFLSSQIDNKRRVYFHIIFFSRKKSASLVLISWISVHTCIA